MRGAGLWLLVAVGGLLAIGAGGWLVTARPSEAPGVVGLLLLFVLGISTSAFGISERHSFAPTRARRVANSTGAGALAAGLLAAALAVPVVTDGRRVAEPQIFPSRYRVEPQTSASASRTADAPNPTTITTAQAFSFFTEKYFPAAMTRPEDALSAYGSSNYQSQKERTGVEQYGAWYKRTKEIPVGSVSVKRYHDLDRTFIVSFTRKMRSGPTQHPQIVYLLACVQQDPRSGECTASGLRIDGSDRVS